jgi:vacuolar-type H+-ATPase catalytic subunit A/Vma1
MLDAILEFYKQGTKALAAGVPFDRFLTLDVLEDISRAKLIKEPSGRAPKEELAALKRTVVEQVSALTKT